MEEDAAPRGLNGYKKNWPTKGKLFLHGFTFEAIAQKAPRGAKHRIEWLHRQADDVLTPQPYEQLARVLRKAGHEAEADKILIQKEEDRPKFDPMSKWRRVGHGLMRALVGYGYRPWRAMLWAAGIVLVGCVLYLCGSENGHIVQLNGSPQRAATTTQPQDLHAGYPGFNAFAFSLDVFVPLVDLRQASHWGLKRNGEQTDGLAILLYGYMYFQVFAGWILTTLFILALSGVIRKRTEGD